MKHIIHSSVALRTASRSAVLAFTIAASIFRFPAQSAAAALGHNYQVKSAADLGSPVWADATGVLPGNGGVLPIVIPINPSQPQPFYKLEA